MRVGYPVLVVAAVSVVFAGGLVAQQGGLPPQPPPRPDVAITTKDLMGGLSNPGRWLTYSGDYSAQRHSPLKQITPANVAQLSAQWTFQTGVTSGFRTQFEATPIVIDGVLAFGSGRGGLQTDEYRGCPHARRPGLGRKAAARPRLG